MSDEPRDDFPRVIAISWTAGKPLEVDTVGDFDDWEIEAALRRVLECLEDTAKEADDRD